MLSQILANEKVTHVLTLSTESQENAREGETMTTDVPTPEHEQKEATVISPQGTVPLDMLEILVNGVFAFAMTLIVKNNIPLPTSVPTEEFDFLVRRKPVTA